MRAINQIPTAAAYVHVFGVEHNGEWAIMSDVRQWGKIKDSDH